jgi:hypothetical protein
MRARHCDGELPARSRGNRANAQAGENADNDGHVPATWTALFVDMFIQGAIIVIHGVLMNRAVGMNMRDNMTVGGAPFVRMAGCKTVVIATGFTGRGR